MNLALIFLMLTHFKWKNKECSHNCLNKLGNLDYFTAKYIVFLISMQNWNIEIEFLKR